VRRQAGERGVLAVPSGHQAAAAASVSFAELRDEPFITLPEAFGSAVRALFVSGCHAAGFAPDIVQTAPDSWTCVALVAAGVGLHFTTDSVVRQMTLDGVRIVPLTEPIPPVFSYLLWRTGDWDPALANVLGLSEQVLPTVA
jgi:DNA-binding transcriptional LysR family regulator